MAETLTLDELAGDDEPQQREKRDSQRTGTEPATATGQTGELTLDDLANDPDVPDQPTPSTAPEPPQELTLDDLAADEPQTGLSDEALQDIKDVRDKVGAPPISETAARPEGERTPPGALEALFDDPLESAQAIARNVSQVVTGDPRSTDKYEPPDKPDKEFIQKTFREFAEQNPEEARKIRAGESKANVAEELAQFKARQNPSFELRRPQEQQRMLDYYRSKLGTPTTAQQQAETKREYQKRNIGTAENIMNSVLGSAARMTLGPVASAGDLLASPAKLAGYDFPSLRQKLEDAIRQQAPRNPEMREDFLTSKLPAGATSMGLFMLGGLAGAGTKAGSLAGAGGMGTALGLDEGYVQTLKRDDPSVLSSIAQIGGHGALGATEAIPVSRWFQRANRLTRGGFGQRLASSLRKRNPVLNTSANVGTSAVAQALEEAGQEYGQEFWGEMLDWSVNESDNRNFWQAVTKGGQRGIEGAKVGATLGGLMGGAAGGIQTRGARDGTQETQQGRVERGQEGRPAELTLRELDQGRAGERGTAEAAEPQAPDVGIPRAEQLAEMPDQQLRQTAQDLGLAEVAESSRPELIGRLTDLRQQLVRAQGGETAQRGYREGEGNGENIGESTNALQPEGGIADDRTTRARPRGAEAGRQPDQVGDALAGSPAAQIRERYPDIQERVARLERQVQRSVGDDRARVQLATDVSPAESEIAREAKEKLGLDIAFIEGGGTNQRPASADQDPTSNLIFLRAGEPETNARRLIQHEWVHDLAQRDPESYNELIDFLRQNSPRLLEIARQRYMQEVGEHERVREEEEAAATTGEILGPEIADDALSNERLEQLARERPTLFQRIGASLRRVMRRLGLVGPELSRSEQRELRPEWYAAAREFRSLIQRTSQQQEGATDSVEVTQPEATDAGVRPQQRSEVGQEEGRQVPAEEGRAGVRPGRPEEAEGQQQEAQAVAEPTETRVGQLTDYALSRPYSDLESESLQSRLNELDREIAQLDRAMEAGDFQIGDRSQQAEQFRRAQLEAEAIEHEQFRRRVERAHPEELADMFMERVDRAQDQPNDEALIEARLIRDRLASMTPQEQAETGVTDPFTNLVERMTARDRAEQGRDRQEVLQNRLRKAADLGLIEPETGQPEAGQPAGQIEAPTQRAEPEVVDTPVEREIPRRSFSRSQVKRELLQEFGRPEGQGVTQQYNTPEYWHYAADATGTDRQRLLADIMAMDRAEQLPQGRLQGVRLGDLEMGERIDVGNSTIEVVDKAEGQVEIERTANEDIGFTKTPGRRHPVDRGRAGPRQILEEVGEQTSYRVPQDTVIPADPQTARKTIREEPRGGQEPPFARRRETARDIEATNFVRPDRMYPKHGLGIRKGQRPFTAPTSPQETRPKVAELVRRFRREGWQGPPILAVGDQALTGTHRLEAAKRAGLSEVPIYDIDPEINQSMYDQIEQTDDNQRPQVLRDMGMEEAARLAQREVDANIEASETGVREMPRFARRREPQEQQFRERRDRARETMQRLEREGRTDTDEYREARIAFRQADQALQNTRQGLAPSGAKPRRQRQREQRQEERRRQAEQQFEQAAQHFGVTDNPRHAGYILPDGRMLDLTEGMGVRQQDHRNLPDTFRKSRESDTDAMLRFMQNGAVRVDGNTGTIDIASELTEDQQRAIREFAQEFGGQVAVEATGPDGTSLLYREPNNVNETMAAVRDAESAVSGEQPRFARRTDEQPPGRRRNPDLRVGSRIEANVEGQWTPGTIEEQIPIDDGRTFYKVRLDDAAIASTPEQIVPAEWLRDPEGVSAEPPRRTGRQQQQPSALEFLSEPTGQQEQPRSDVRLTYDRVYNAERPERWVEGPARRARDTLARLKAAREAGFNRFINLASDQEYEKALQDARNRDTVRIDEAIQLTKNALRTASGDPDMTASGQRTDDMIPSVRTEWNHLSNQLEALHRIRDLIAAGDTNQLAKLRINDQDIMRSRESTMGDIQDPSLRMRGLEPPDAPFARRRDRDQQTLAGEIEGRATTGQTGGLFGPEETRRPQQQEQAAIPGMPEGAEQFGLSKQDVANASLFTDQDTPSAAFAFGVKRWQAGHDSVERLQGMTKQQLKEARQGFNAAKRRSSEIQEQDREKRRERDKGDDETSFLFARRNAPSDATENQVAQFARWAGIKDTARSFVPLSETTQGDPDTSTLRNIFKGTRRQLRSRGNMTEEAFQQKVLRNGKIRAELQNIKAALREFHRAVKQHYGSERRMSAWDIHKMDLALKGQESMDQFPAEIANALQRMRDHVDAMSQEMIRQGVIEGDLVATVRENMGTYLNRSYRVFDDPKWAKKVKKKYPEIVNRAKAFIRKEHADDIARQWAEQNADRVVQEGDIQPQDANYYQSAESARAAAQQRQDVPDTDQVIAVKVGENQYVLRPIDLQAIRSRLQNPDNPENDWFESQVQARINGLLYRGPNADTPTAMIAQGKLGSKDLSILKRRKGIPAEIRQLWGEYRDPKVNYARSVSKMSNLIANHKFLTTVREAGLAGGWFHDTDQPYQDPETGESYHAKIAADESDVLKPLNGLYTTPEIKQAFEDAVETDGPASLAMRWYYWANLHVKSAATIQNWMTQVRNLMSWPLIHTANGNWDPRHSGAALGGILGDIGVGEASNFSNKVAQAISGLSREQREQYARRATELNVIHDSAMAGDIQKMIQDTGVQDADLPKLTENLFQRIARAPYRIPGRLYEMGDDLPKLFAWENEKAKYRKRKPDWTEQQVEETAARILRDTNPTYSYVPRAVRKLRRFPLVGPFVSFFHEMYRNTGRRFELIRNEWNDPDLKDLAAKRLVGQTIALSIPSALAAGTAYMFGVDDETEEYAREFFAPWSRFSQIAWLGEDGQGRRLYIDLSYTDPFQQFKKPLIAFMNNERWSDAMYYSLKEAFEPYIQEDLLANRFFNVIRNTTDTGAPVYNESASFEDQTLSVLNHFYEVMEPGTIRSLRRIGKGLEGEVRSYGRAYDPKIEATAMLTGIRAKKLDVPQALSFKAGDHLRLMRDATGILTEVAKNRGEVSEEALRDAYQRMETSRKERFRRMYKTVQAARGLGMTDRAIFNVLDSAGMSKADADRLLQGRYQPYAPSDRFLQSTIEQAVASARTEQQAAEARNKFIERRNLIRQLAGQTEPVQIGQQNTETDQERTEVPLP